MVRRAARLDAGPQVVAHGALWTAKMPQRSCLTPIGELTVSEADGRIVSLDWGRGRDQGATPLLARAIEQLQDYFDGTRLTFDLPLAPHGTPFQRRVWAALEAIPPGETRSYGEIARALGSAARAIGRANGSNPIPIFIPCHRVLAAQGMLGGYSGGDGPATKTWLLDHERRHCVVPIGPASQTELPLGSSRGGLRGINAR
jgi:methylated-DNA-[protein]-cysteine S-methyltransferase